MSVKIFISCVSDEFRAYRDQLRRDLTRDNVEVKVQEDFKDKGVVTLDMLDIYIRACDAVIHLVGSMTGAAANPASTRAILDKYPDIAARFPPLGDALARGEDISYTQWEAWLALYHGKTLLIAKAGYGAPRGREVAPDGKELAPDVASRAAQQAHIMRLRAAGHYPGCSFDTADQLAKHVFASPVLDLLAAQQGGMSPRGANRIPDVGLATTGVAICVLVLLATPIIADEWAKTLGVPVAAPLALVLAAGCIALPLIFVRYLIMLRAGDAPTGSRDRKGYDALRGNLATGGLAVQLYARWLTAFLDRVDRFLGDAGMADRTLFPHAFGLKMPAPLWTAPAFDRCLSLALLYPLVAVFIVWAVSGHIGPAEQDLGLRAYTGWSRGVVMAAAATSAFALWRSFRSMSAWLRIMWAAVTAAATAAGAGAVPGAFGLAGVVAGVVAVILAVPGTVAVALAVTFAILAAIGDFALIAFAVFPIAASLNASAIRSGRQGVFMLSLMVTLASGCLVAAHSMRVSNYEGGVLVLFLGLLTLLNAPFDWATVGLMRALLRRGLELKGWWPFALAVADALAAAIVIALLALIMVIGVQTFDALAAHGSGTAVLPLINNGTLFEETPDHGLLVKRAFYVYPPLLDGIAAHPEAPEYWWVYALLLSTMIPSVINLVIGGTALMRAATGVSTAMLRLLPATGGVPTYNRAIIAAALTAQAALGAILGVAVQALVAWGLIFHAMPAVGLGLLDLARRLAVLDLPMRTIELLGGQILGPFR